MGVGLGRGVTGQWVRVRVRVFAVVVRRDIFLRLPVLEVVLVVWLWMESKVVEGARRVLVALLVVYYTIRLSFGHLTCRETMG